VDDHLMEITHIIRGEEWINSVPKHLLLYRYFGWEPPVWCHLPLLRNPDKSKLSKRKNPVSVEWYRRVGILPEALLNYLGLMGWHLSDDREKFSVQDMVEHFKLEDVSLGGPVFDMDKLLWLNGRYLREELTTSDVADRLEVWGLGRERLEAILEIAKGRMSSLSDWGDLTGHFFTDRVPLDREKLVLDGKTPEETAEVMQMVIWELEKLASFSADDIQTVFRAMAEELGMKLKHLAAPFYVAMSGKKVSTPLFDTMAILGSDVSRMRIRYAIEELGGISKKRLKALEKKCR